MPKEIDARGLTCPQPAFLTKQAVDEGHSELIIFADDATSRDNVRRIGENHNYQVTVQSRGNEFIIEMSKFQKE